MSTITNMADRGTPAEQLSSYRDEDPDEVAIREFLTAAYETGADIK